MKNSNLVFLLMVWIELVLCVDFLSKFYQHDYKMKDLRFDMVRFNKKLINHYEIRTFKYNRTTTAMNMTYNYKKDLKDNIEVIVQGYKFLSNEYREFPGCRFQINVCKSFLSNMGGLNVQNSQCGNVTGCRNKANVTLRMCNFIVDESRLPPYFPNGRFMFELNFLYIEEPLVDINLYLEIYRPIAYPKK